MDATAIGAPIINENEKVIGAVIISGYSFHYEGENLVRLIEIVNDMGVGFSRRMGYLNDL